MSEFDFELDGMPAEPVAPEPVPVDAGPTSPLPSEVTARFAAEAQRLEAETLTPAAPEQQPAEPPAPAELAPDQQQAINDYLEAQLSERATARAAELIDQQISELYEQFDPATVDALIAQLPAEVQQQIAERHGEYVEAVEFSELLASEATQERAQAVVDEGVARMRELVDSWNAEQVGAAPVDVAKVYELALERWPAAAEQVGATDEVAVGLLREAFEEIAVEQIGEQAAFRMVEQEAAKVGAQVDVLKTKALADAIWPEIVRQFGSDDQEAARQAIAAAVQLQTNFREPTSARSVTRYYGARAAEIRRANGEVPGAPSARPSGGGLPSLVTAKFAAEAAAIRARSGL